jgi:hypothetical protein
MIGRAPLPLILSAMLLGSANAQTQSEPIPMRLVFQASHYFDTDSPPLYAVWRSEEEARAFLRDAPHDAWPFPYYPVDYTREMAIAVALGARGYANSLVTVDAVLDVGDRLIVYTTEYEPCGGARPIINPSIVVAVPQDDRPVEFLPTRVIPFTGCR